MLKRIIALLCAVALLAGCAGHGTERAGEQEENSIEFFAMDTYMNIRAWGADDALLRRAEALAEELEASLSTTLPDSAVYRLNHTGSAELPEDVAALLDRALALCSMSDGALDITIYPVVRAWGFTTPEEDYRVPDSAELAALLEHVDYSRVSLDGVNASVPEGFEIDLGAVTKGYTGDRLAALLRENGVGSALLDLGGNIQAVGAKTDGSAWRVAIRHPERDGLLGVVSVVNQAVVTSGGYERYFVDGEGRLWWHIMDPADGYPAQNGLVSVTVIGDEGLYCDALSTALFIMGPERAASFWRAHRDFDAVLYTEDGEILITPGLAERFSLLDGMGTPKVIEDA